jgi:hypothetical protein
VAPVDVAPGATRVAVDVGVGTGAGTDSGRAIGLNCAGAGDCNGVYPVAVALRRADGTVAGRLNTFLTYAASPSPDPLRVAVVLPVGTAVRFAPDAANAARALRAPSPAAVTALAGLIHTVAGRPTVPTTVLVDPHTVQGLTATGSAEGRQALLTLGALSQNPSVTEFPAVPFVPVDLGALAGAGLTGEIVYQMAVGALVLGRAGIHTDATASTAVVRGGVTSSLATGLSDATLARVVVPDTALAGDPGRFGVAQPFSLSLGRSTTVAAAASDSGLAAHFAAAGRDPVLAAQQALADLAFIESEEPGARQPRGVVAVAPGTPPLDPLFVDTLLAGLASNPDVRAVTLEQFFAQVPVGGNGEPATRQASAPAATSGVSDAAAGAISRARQRNDAFHSAVLGSPPVLARLDALLLAAEAEQLGSAGRDAAIATYERALGTELSAVRLSSLTVTLTQRTGRIPITFLSSAPYALTGDIALTSGKFEFPQGSNRPGFLISRSTNVLPMEVEARTSGDLPLAVTLTAPRNDPGALPLVIARGQLTVRSTATSVVGVVLTLLAVGVLLVWWVRTWRRGRAGRGGRAGHAGLRR